MKLWLPEIISSLKRHKTVLGGSEITISRGYMEFSFIYVLAPILSLGSSRLHIMCVRTITGWNFTESSIALC